MTRAMLSFETLRTSGLYFTSIYSVEYIDFLACSIEYGQGSGHLYMYCLLGQGFFFFEVGASCDKVYVDSYFKEPGHVSELCLSSSMHENSCLEQPKRKKRTPKKKCNQQTARFIRNPCNAEGRHRHSYHQVGLCSDVMHIEM